MEKHINMKAILRKDETPNCQATSLNGIHTITIKHGVEYEFMYDSNEDFYLIVDDVIYPDCSTAFDFV